MKISKQFEEKFSSFDTEGEKENLLKGKSFKSPGLKCEFLAQCSRVRAREPSEVSKVEGSRRMLATTCYFVYRYPC
ncbi:hypothetical protein WN943_012185 [Citrus x changshan-huyou]